MKSVLVVISLMSSCILYSQKDPMQLMKPTGIFEVGTMIYQWTDSSRYFNMTGHQGDKRTIVSQLWYPAEVAESSASSLYAPFDKDYDHVKTTAFSRPSFSSALSKSKIIFLSPGRGTPSFLYSGIAEELASHGFIVAGIDMPAIGYTVYNDGFIVTPSSEFQPPPGLMGGPYEKVDHFFERPTDIGYRDLEFALSEIKKLNDSDVNGRFNGKIDVSAIGIFGHSLGGRIAGEFAARNKNVQAYISMEGIPPRDVRFEGKIEIPMVMLCSSGTWPYAEVNYNSLFENRSNIVYMIELPDFGHNSVTDEPFIYPDKFNYQIDPEQGILITRNIITAYFQSYLGHQVIFDDYLKDVKRIILTKYD